MVMKSKTTVLLVEDSLSLAAVYQGYLRNEPYAVVHEETGAAAMQRIEQSLPDVILLDLNLPDMHGMDILKHIQNQQLPCTVVVITANGSVDVAVDAMRYGAFDFVIKPCDAKRLLVTLRNAIEHQKLTHLVESYRENFDRTGYHGFIGASLPMQAVYRIIDSAAPSKATVFITGESGTGKEVCAEAIHKQSPRNEKPFVALNCAAIPRDLLESEIFGHMKGAFTGAANERQGAASRANGGTLFLDEICELELDLQSKLLRFIQTGSFQKVGGNKIEKVDVRILCATNRDPLVEVEEGRFREDLFYRLHVIPLHLPPLREREEDMLIIARNFLMENAKEEGKGFKRFSPACEEILLGYHWPGNVRQLQNVVRNIVVLNDGEGVTAEMLPPPLNQKADASMSGVVPVVNRVFAGSAEADHSAAGIRPLWQVEKQAIESAIDCCDGNIPKAAALLEISASTIYRKRQLWENGKG